LFGYVCLKLLTDIALCNIYALSRIPLPYDRLFRLAAYLLDNIRFCCTFSVASLYKNPTSLDLIRYDICQGTAESLHSSVCPLSVSNNNNTKKSVFSFVPGSQHDATHYLLLSAGACTRYRPLAGTRRRRTQLSIGMSCPQGA